MPTLRIRSRADIDPAVERLHDWWLDLDRVVWDRGRQELRMPFVRRVRPHGADVPEVFLRISGVTSYSVMDTEQVGWYDLNEIVLKDTRLVFDFATPLEVEVDVIWADWKL